MIQKERFPQSKDFHFNTPYVGQLRAQTDWVAGGNFDGYLRADVITFYEEGCKVTWEERTIAHRYDGQPPKDRLLRTGTYDFSDKRAILLFGYRGVFLGDKNEFLVLDPLNTSDALCFSADL